MFHQKHSSNTSDVSVLKKMREKVENNNDLDKRQVLEDYNHSKVINPPSKLSPIYSCSLQSEQTKINLAVSYSYLVKNEFNNMEKGIQLFEIPATENNCQAYCKLGYGYNKSGPIDEYWNPGKDWIELSDTTDVSCHKGFEKIFQYGGHNNHLARQWGDGTILHKIGCTASGASAVLRVIDSNHPCIVNAFGSIDKIWIKPYHSAVPKPYLRWQSTHSHDYVGSAYHCTKSDTLTLEDLKESGDGKWQHYYNEMKKSNSSSTHETSKDKVSKLQDSFFAASVPIQTKDSHASITMAHDKDKKQKKHDCKIRKIMGFGSV